MGGLLERSICWDSVVLLWTLMNTRSWHAPCPFDARSSVSLNQMCQVLLGPCNKSKSENTKMMEDEIWGTQKKKGLYDQECTVEAS